MLFRSQVTGKVVSVNSEFADGGFFKKGEVLLTIERDDYEFSLARAQSALAQSQQRLAEERGRSRQARREWRELGSKEANDLFLRKPQLRAAQSAVTAAEADVSAAELALDRTVIRAPFDGFLTTVMKPSAKRLPLTIARLSSLETQTLATKKNRP